MSPKKQESEPKTFEVMAPMNIKFYNNPSTLGEDDWQLFAKWAKELNNMGVDSISISIFWGMVESEGNMKGSTQQHARFEWSYFDRLVDIIASEGLRWSPSFSLHLGGDFKDNYIQPLPDWIWGTLLLENEAINSISDLKYVSETGEKSFEYVSLWADDFVLPYYQDFMKAFAQHFATYADMTEKLMVSMGPSGELRYPSFNFHDWGSYPNRGTLQCYSHRAQADLQQYLLEKYGSLSSINQAWGRHYDALEQIAPPDPLKEDIFLGKKYLHDRYALDVLEWYHHSLTWHGCRMLEAADKAFAGTPFADTPLGFRISGVHWKISDPEQPRVAEVTSGIIRPHRKLNFTDQGEYVESLEAIVPKHLRQRVVLHFTCTEKVNKDYKGYSRAEDLTGWLGDAAHELGIKIVAENAMYGGLYAHQGWDQMEKALKRKKGYSGLNIRSIRHLLENNELGYFRLKNLINESRNRKPTQPVAQRTFRAMGPLHIKIANNDMLLEEVDWFEFDQHLKTMRNIGVTAISIDVWWGLVCREGPDLYDWAYYDQVVNMIRANGLNWVPILSFHQAGGNVNDDFSQVVPVWLWGRLMERHPEIARTSDLQYVSETGDPCLEYVALWADPFILPYYRKFMDAFREHFAPFGKITEEINISMGPAGELRYPSFNAHDWGGYPNRGTLQCYSDLAKRHLQADMASKYASIEALNEAWGTKLQGFEEVAFPSNGDPLFEGKAYCQTARGRDLLAWYHESLMEHCQRLLTEAAAAFEKGKFSQVPIGFKIAGVHWKVSDPEMPRAAEITAGLIASHENLDSTNQHEYLRTLTAAIPKKLRKKVVVHFTCLEKFNHDEEGYSRAEDLVVWLAEAAASLGITIKGENATTWELSTKEGWDQMEKALNRTHPYAGLTILRMKNLVVGNEYGLNRYKQLIAKWK